MDQGCSYFTQASLKSLNFLVFIVKYSGLKTDIENTCMDKYMFGVIYVKN